MLRIIVEYPFFITHDTMQKTFSSVFLKQHFSFCAFRRSSASTRTAPNFLAFESFQWSSNRLEIVDRSTFNDASVWLDQIKLLLPLQTFSAGLDVPRLLCQNHSFIASKPVLTYWNRWCIIIISFRQHSLTFSSTFSQIETKKQIAFCWHKIRYIQY